MMLNNFFKNKIKIIILIYIFFLKKLINGKRDN
jgi:hypothetical protein